MLASGSPRRLALLRQAGIEADAVDPADLDENRAKRETPMQMAARLAGGKAAAVAPRHPGAYVLAADTVVACGRRDLPKPASEETARQCLALLSGRRHRVHTGLCVVAPDGRCAQRVVTTVVTFKRFSDEEMRAYLASGEWRGKAGGYAIQGRADAFVRSINGSYSNVVGLPLNETTTLLAGLGYPVWRANG